MMKNKLFLSSVVLGVAGLTTAAIAQNPADEEAKGSPVTISGCVATDKENSFVLTHVSELAGPRSTSTAPTLGAMTGVQGGGQEIIYWLSHDSVKLMRGHLGHKVEVTGTITDVTTGTLRVKQEPGKQGPDNKVVVKAEGKEATAETDRPVGPGSAPAMKSDQKQTLPVRRVKVDTVKMVSETCG